tara:strand:+ start:1035 stop:2057 length:1023 start_codon:yes stop_codon:yes gene_type:complete
MKVLLTGGAGYIGSNVLLALRDSGYETLILDNFCNSSEERLKVFAKLIGGNLNYVKSDIRSIKELRKVFSQHEIESVIHLAGLKSVSESIENPNLYYENNVVGSKNLLNIMSEFSVNKLIFSSSATVYGNPNTLPITEDHELKPMNNYGQTKLEVENLISEFVNNNNSQAVSLRYFNPVGSDLSNNLGEFILGMPSNLMPIINLNAFGHMNEFNIYGDDYATHDGSAIRDFIHISDLAQAHVSALNFILDNDHKSHEAINVGTGVGFTVKEIISCFENVNSVKLKFKVSKRRAGDIEASIASPSKAKQILGWSSSYSLEDMCMSAFNFYKKHPNAIDLKC